MASGIWALVRATQSGLTIAWVGTALRLCSDSEEPQLAVLFRLLDPVGLTTWHTLTLKELQWADDCFENVAVRLESDEPASKVGTVWSIGSWLDILRLAAINGVTMCSTVGVGRSLYRPLTCSVCVMGYDLEICCQGPTESALPLPCQSVLCGTLWCCCGYSASFHTWGSASGSTKVDGSREVLSAMLKCIESHRPVWLVGYNCYVFDNSYFVYHLGSTARTAYAMPIRLSKSFGSSFATVLTIEGVNNVDAYVYLDATMRSSFGSLSLASVCSELGLPPKLDMPPLNPSQHEPIDKCITYCMRDSELTALVFIKLSLEERLCSMAYASHCPVLDVVKYSTGIMSACTLSSYALAEGKLMDWSPLTRRVDFKGGLVMEPRQGLYFNVFVADFIAMYPTIMINCNVSPTP